MKIVSYIIIHAYYYTHHAYNYSARRIIISCHRNNSNKTETRIQVNCSVLWWLVCLPGILQQCNTSPKRNWNNSYLFTPRVTDWQIGFHLEVKYKIGQWCKSSGPATSTWLLQLSVWNFTAIRHSPRLSTTHINVSVNINRYSELIQK